MNGGEEEEQTPSVAGASTSCETSYRLSGYVYDDSNSNGTLDDGETRLGSVEVTISSEGFEDTVFTNAEGYWELLVCPGEYDVTVANENLPSGYTVSAEGEKTLGVSVDDSDVAGVNISANSSLPAFPWWILLLILLVAMGTGGYYLYRRQGEGELKLR
jgi:hypothetical protein